MYEIKINKAIEEHTHDIIGLTMDRGCGKEFFRVDEVGYNENGVPYLLLDVGDEIDAQYLDHCSYVEFHIATPRVVVKDNPKFNLTLSEKELDYLIQVLEDVEDRLDEVNEVLPSEMFNEEELSQMSARVSKIRQVVRDNIKEVN